MDKMRVDYRLPEYLSPSAYMTFLEGEDEYYLKYLCPDRPPRDPQNCAMALGSGFDAFVKCELYRDLVGGDSGGFVFETLFESQVEPHVRDQVLATSTRMFEMYKECGAYADLCLDLGKSLEDVCLEDDICLEVDGLPLRGKPDVFFRVGDGMGVSFDFKVNGWYNMKDQLQTRLVSPKQGYIRCRSSISKYNKGAHKKCTVSRIHGLYYNDDMTLDQVDYKWAIQLCVYSWLAGNPVDSDCLAGIEQICGLPLLNNIRVAQHRNMIPATFSRQVFDGMKELWDRVQSGKFISDERRNILDDRSLDDEFYSSAVWSRVP